ncbi:YicC/YloC family endoribonuclease [Salinibacillus xinjiangensis]|uniref:YicC/YloC family endoribonuclease n=1 Tax=Salinibacillus xinjiangensis TaxID=1229268 RepID=UPI001890CBAA|nr:YicC/YloC family endoribonuclease [Salinibacillus xinjiangensis]
MNSLVTSMTGYGREVTTLDNTRITVEVRTVNHRFLDLSIKMPKMLLYIEENMKKKARSYFKRGRIDVFVTIEGEGLVNRSLQVDWNLLDQYMETFQALQKKYQLADSLGIKEVLKLEEVFSVEEQEDANNKFEETLLNTCEKAIVKASEMRKREGNIIYDDLRNRTTEIKQTVKQLEKHRQIVIEQYRERILQRLKEYLTEELREDDSKVIQEVALMAEKGDITEEITRLFSHLEQFESSLEKQEPVGRKLDFIVQEMLRETNTIGSKSNDVQITEWVVTIKSEIEKLKEQVQNVE